MCRDSRAQQGWVRALSRQLSDVLLVPEHAAIPAGITAVLERPAAATESGPDTHSIPAPHFCANSLSKIPLHPSTRVPFCSPSHPLIQQLCAGKGPMHQVGIKMCSEQSKRQFCKSYFGGIFVPPSCGNAGTHAKHEHVGCPFHYVSMHNFLSVFCLCCNTASFSTGHCWPC